jgi:hypothetical protein
MAARLLDDDVGVDRMLVEDLGGVAHDDGGDHRQARAHPSRRWWPRRRPGRRRRWDRCR